MWGGLTVCGLRVSRKLHPGKLLTALFTGWLIVSMDMLLDVAAIRLNGGFWVWEGRPVTPDVNHHMFMSVIWVNFLGYLFETPAVVCLFLKAEEKAEKRGIGKLILQTLLIGPGGVAVVGAASGLSLFLNELTDEWFACVAYLLLWTLILCGMIVQAVRACSESPRVRMAPSDFSLDDAKTAGNTLCINEDFGKIWRKRCKPDVRGEILNRL